MKSYIDWTKRMACKYTILLCIMAFVSYALMFLTYPSFLLPKAEGIVEKIEKDTYWRNASRHSYKEVEEYRVFIKNMGSYTTLNMAAIDSFGIENIIGKKAVFIYSENKALQINTLYSLYIGGQVVEESKNTILEFIISAFFAISCTWGALYGIKADYLKRDPSKPHR